MVFCNVDSDAFKKIIDTVTILILIDGFLQYDKVTIIASKSKVTILILIDGFLQSGEQIVITKEILESQSLF